MKGKRNSPRERRAKLQQKRQKARMKKRRTIAAIIGVLLIGGFYSFTPDQQIPGSQVLSEADFASLPVKAEIGAKAPDIKLADVNGNLIALSDMQGKPVAIMFFHSW